VDAGGVRRPCRAVQYPRPPLWRAQRRLWSGRGIGRAKAPSRGRRMRSAADLDAPPDQPATRIIDALARPEAAAGAPMGRGVAVARGAEGRAQDTAGRPGGDGAAPAPAGIPASAAPASAAPAGSPASAPAIDRPTPSPTRATPTPAWPVPSPSRASPAG